jgi:hypothetical protein
MALSEARHKAATAVLPPNCETVIPNPFGMLCDRMSEHLGTNCWTLYSQIVSRGAALVGSGTNVVVSPKHSMQTRNGIRPWSITSAPSGSNKSGPFILCAGAFDAALQQLHDDGMEGVLSAGGVGLVDISVSMYIVL